MTLYNLICVLCGFPVFLCSLFWFGCRACLCDCLFVMSFFALIDNCGLGPIGCNCDIVDKARTSSDAPDVIFLRSSDLCGRLQRFAWNGFLIFWIRNPDASNRIRSEVFFPVAGSGLDLDFVCWENVAGCLLDLYLPGLNQESDCLCLVGTGSWPDSDSLVAKQNWIRTQKNQSLHTSSQLRPNCFFFCRIHVADRW